MSESLRNPDSHFPASLSDPYFLFGGCPLALPLSMSPYLSTLLLPSHLLFPVCGCAFVMMVLSLTLSCSYDRPYYFVGRKKERRIREDTTRAILRFSSTETAQRKPVLVNVDATLLKKKSILLHKAVSDSGVSEATLLSHAWRIFDTLDADSSGSVSQMFQKKHCHPMGDPVDACLQVL